MSAPRQFCTFHLDGLYFGLDVQRVQEVLRHQAVTRVPLAADVVEGLINLRGQIVCAVDLRRRLELEPRQAGVAPMVIVIRTEDGAVAVLVDEIGEVVEVDEETFEAPPETLRGSARQLIPGAYKLPDRLLLVLDADRAVSAEVAA